MKTRDLNTVIVSGTVGNVTRLVVDKAGGRPCVSFEVISRTKYTQSSGNQEIREDFHPVKLWGKLGEMAADLIPSVKNGVEVVVTGYLSSRKFTSQKGTQYSITTITPSSIRVIGDEIAASNDLGDTDQEDIPF